jgi:hypothetical protein
MHSPTEKPLNDRLRFITEAGQIDHAAIDADIPRRAAEMQRRLGEALARTGRSPVGSYEWYRIAKDDLYVFANGELQLWEMRKITRDGRPAAADVAPAPVGPFNDNHGDTDAALAGVKQAMAVL